MTSKNSRSTSPSEGKEATKGVGSSSTVLGLDRRFVLLATVSGVAFTMIAFYTSLIALQRDTITELQHDVFQLQVTTKKLEDSLSSLNSVVVEVALTSQEMTINDFARRCQQLEGTLDPLTLRCEISADNPIFFSPPDHFPKVPESQD